MVLLVFKVYYPNYAITLTTFSVTKLVTLGRCCTYAKDTHLGQRIVFDIKLWKIFRIYATDSERFAATWTCFQQEKLNYGDTALYFSGKHN